MRNTGCFCFCFLFFYDVWPIVYGCDKHSMCQSAELRLQLHVNLLQSPAGHWLIPILTVISLNRCRISHIVHICIFALQMNLWCCEIVFYLVLLSSWIDKMRKSFPLTGAQCVCVLFALFGNWAMSSSSSSCVPWDYLCLQNWIVELNDSSSTANVT